MRFFILGWLTWCFAFSALAQPSYSQIVDQQRRCEMHGEMWREIKAKDTVGGKPLKYYSKEHTAGRIEDAVFNEIMMAFIYASSDSLRTPRDAYMKGWAECMDKK